MREEPAQNEAVVARIAARQHGVVSAAQLAAAGFDKSAVTRRVQAGRLHRVHRGVYAVGNPRLGFEGRCLAAVTACGGPGPLPASVRGRRGPPAFLAVVSHRSAAALWGMLSVPAGWIEISIPSTNGRKRRRGIVIHRSACLAAGSSASGERLVVERDSIPVTTPARTLRDLKRAGPEEVVQRAFRRALDLRLVPPGVLGPEPDLTRSGLERRLPSLCRRHRLPRPEVNARLGPYEVDFLWREHRLVVEADSWRHHSDRAAFEADRIRDARLQAAGYRVLRLTHRRLRAEPAAVADSLQAVMRAGDVRPGPGRLR